MAFLPKTTGAVLFFVITSCGGQVGEQRPDGAVAVGTGGAFGSGGVGGTSVDAGSGSGGYGAALDEPWDAGLTTEDLCQLTGPAVPAACTPGELSYRLSRRWWQCSGQFAFNTEDAVGIEFTSGGQWYLLVDSGGAVVRGSGASYQGTWEMVDTSSMNGPCSIQVNIIKSGAVFSFPMFSKHPTRVFLNTGGDGGAPEYVAIP